MSERMARPWLLLDWVYRLTDTANAELDQKKQLDMFTKRVNQSHNELKLLKSNFLFVSKKKKKKTDD